MSQITIIAIVITGLICFPTAGDESGYYAIDIMGKRIGYADYFIHESESRVYVASQTFMKVKMLGQPYDVTYQAIGTYSSQMTPSYYAVTLTQAGMVTEVQCEFSEHQVQIKRTIADSTISETSEVGDFMVEGNLMDTWNLMFRSAEEITGTRKFQVFSPLLSDVTEVEAELMGVELLSSLEREEYCNVYKVTFTELAQEMKLWVAKSDKIMLKMEVPAEQTVIQIANKEEFGKTEDFEVLSKAFVIANVSIPNWKDLTSMKTRIKVESSGELFSFDELQSDLQKFEGIRKGNIAEGIIETKRYEYRKQNSPSFPMEEINVSDKFLQPGFRVESDDPEIITKAKELTIDTTDAWDAVQKIASWVSQNIKYRITGGSAKQALLSREGDCGPHTMLTIALCRAAGIPARIVGGVVYSSSLGGNFGQHYWTEVWMGEDGWIPLDSTTGEIGVLSPAHITLWRMDAVKFLEAEVLEYTPMSR